MVTLYTATTPNGRKVSIFLEEAGVPYTVRAIDLVAQEQKQPWFLGINPNGRIPAIVDHEADDFAVFESGAILIYLAEKAGQFLSRDVRGRSTAIQWLMFQMGGIGPMQGQANVFYRYAPEKIPYAIERYRRETRRLYEVLDSRLGDVPFLAGGYSIADMATYPWVHAHEWSGIPVEGLANLQRWLREVGERPAVKKGMDVPRWAAPKDPAATIEAARKMLV